jgi:hypothetical protein
MRLQGCERSALATRRDDLHETPPEAVRALLAVEPLPQKIWEPCAGRGAIVRELVWAGHEVSAMDLVAYDGADPNIETPIDFLMEYRAPSGFDYIVTNPPFKLADEFVRHGLTLVSRVVVLLRLAALEGAGRSDLIDRHLRRVWLGRERLPMMHREGWTGPRLTSAGAPFAWFVFEREPRSEIAFMMGRMSWRLP